MYFWGLVCPPARAIESSIIKQPGRILYGRWPLDALQVEAMIIAHGNGIVLRPAQAGELPQLAKITFICDRPIAESTIAILGPECYEVVRPDPHLTWQERKTGQAHRLFAEHPEQLLDSFSSQGLWPWQCNADG